MATQKKTSHWKSQMGYIWAMVGSAVGFANILSFSAKCYYNGGAAFFIPLLTAVAILGFPLLILEGVIGQQLQLPLVSAFRRVAGRWGSFFGWMSILGVLTIGSYYTVINAWTLAYIYFAGTGQIGLDTESFFANEFLGDTGSLTVLGSFSLPVALFTILVVLFTGWVNTQNIQEGIEKISSLFLPMLFVILAGFAVAVCFLPGAWFGFRQYLIPDFAALANPKLWLTSFGHVFFSFSVALGIIVGYSRYTGEEVNIARSMMWVAAGDLLTSLISGFVIFGGIGYMAHISSTPFNEVVTSSGDLFGLGFVVFPRVMHTFGPIVAAVVGVLFFFSLFIAGITGLFSIVESVSGNIEVESGVRRERAVRIVLAIILGLSFMLCFGNGPHLIGAIDAMTAGVNVLVAGLAMICVFMYHAPEVVGHQAWFVGDRRAFAYYALKYVSPVVLLFVLGSSIVDEVQTGFGLAEAIRWGWLACAVLVAWRLSRMRQNAAD